MNNLSPTKKTIRGFYIEMNGVQVRISLYSGLERLMEPEYEERHLIQRFYLAWPMASIYKR
jgi:hypothetical protein